MYVSSRAYGGTHDILARESQAKRGDSGACNNVWDE